jgi:hypothetical protein
MAIPSLSYSDFLAPMMPRMDKKKSLPFDPRTVADEEKKRLLEQEERSRKELVADETDTNSNAPDLTADQDQPFREQMKGREVLLRREAGDLLGAQEQMQDPNYQLGSGSSLRKTPQPLAPDWTRMNRASRRLRRKGFAAEAAKMASMAELERLGTPNIATQEQRNRMAFMDMERDAKEYDKKKSEDLYDQYMLKRRQKRMESANTTSI